MRRCGCAVLCGLFLALATPAAAAPEAWYAFSRDSQRCESRASIPDDAMQSPAAMMALLDSIGWAYTMHDVTEGGTIVQTTMTVLPTAERPAESRVTWYRGQARCEQAQRMKQQGQEQRREKYR